MDPSIAVFALQRRCHRDWPLFAAVLATLGCTHAPASRTYTAGDTMVPSIAIGARVAVHPLEGSPKRGVAIVFRAPERPDREFVKRIIGIPGDVISTSGTEIVLNGHPIPRCPIGPYHYTEEDGGTRAGELWLEAFGGASWLVFHSTAKVSIPSGPWTVAPGEVFVLGDSRENSRDSRFWFGGKGGGLPMRDIVGTIDEGGGHLLPKGAENLAPALAKCPATLTS